MDKVIETAIKKFPRFAEKRIGFIYGYRQAEEDLALTWKDVAILITIYEQEADAGNISRYDDENAPSIQDASEIILKRFNEIRKK